MVVLAEAVAVMVTTSPGVVAVVIGVTPPPGVAPPPHTPAGGRAAETASQALG